MTTTPVTVTPGCTVTSRNVPSLVTVTNWLLAPLESGEVIRICPGSPAPAQVTALPENAVARGSPESPGAAAATEPMAQIRAAVATNASPIARKKTTRRLVGLGIIPFTLKFEPI